VLGTLFPFLMRVGQRRAASAGDALGTLAAANTIGAILGSLAGGFVLLEAFGMWRTMQLIAAAYLVAAFLLPTGRSLAGVVVRSMAAAAILLAFTLLDPSRLPVLGSDPLRGPQRVLETWEGSDCTVAALAGPDGVSLQINSHYGLGSTGAAPVERLQAAIPLLAYPRAESLFFLGMGTGITAGAALDPQFPQVRRVVACELVPEVIEAARRHIAGPEGDDPTGGLFRDPRATVLCADGRHELMAARAARFDIVNADLFVPFRCGAGSLYSLEHFRTVRERLAPGGVFVQWLPLYQVTEREFGTIARTMLEAFDTVSLWRNTFQPGDEVVALVGHTTPAPVPAAADDSLAARREAVAGRDHHDLDQLALPLDAETILFFYCGNLSASADRFAGYPLNTDDRPVIEYLAPRTYRDRSAGAVPWFVGPRLAALVEDLQRRCPPDADPLLAERSPAERLLPVAAAAFHRARLWQVAGDEASCRRAWDEFVAAWTAAPPSGSQER
jgi:spermidine synthase